MATDNNIVDEVLKINISGNVIPMSWYKTITRESGKPYLEAITILSDIVYWYKPSEVRDETSGELIGYKKKFKSDLLQRSYQQLSNMFGISKREATNAVVRLEQLGVIKRVFRTLTINDVVTSNVLFLELNSTRLKELTYPETAPKSEDEIAITFKSDTPHFQKGDPPLSKVTRNTKTTTKTTKDKKERKKEETEKPKKENQKTFDEIIDNYTQNEDLRKELREHLKTRKAKKSALTNRAIELSLKELDRLAESEEEKILIVQQAIMRGWTGFFPVKDNSVNESNGFEVSGYDMEMYGYNIFEDEEKGYEEKWGKQNK